MADEKEKFDIEDIKDPEEELDLDKAVSEEEPSEEKEKKDPVETMKENTEETTAQETLDNNSEETEPAVPLRKIKKTKGKKPWVKYAVVGALVALVAAAAVLGVMYYLQQKDKQTQDTEEVSVTEEATEETKTEEEASEVETEYAYISSEVGLNLRAEPNTKAAVLVIIPFGTKIEVLEKQTGWIKTTYESKTGWVSADYTQTTDPLVYKDTTYGFGLTFKASWAGYKFIEYKNSESTTVKTYYVCLPTADKNWDETSVGIPKGYASLFVMGVYTKEEWAKMAGGEILPAKLGEGDKYVYTYLPGQAHATDLATQYGEISQIIKTFEVLK